MSESSSNRPASGSGATRKKPFNPLALVLIVSGVFFLIFLMITGAFFMWSNPKDWEYGESGTASLFSGGEDVVGVVELQGVILDSKKLLKQLKGFKKNKRVKAVVMRMNSPGGAVAPSQEIYEMVKQIKEEKPVVVSMASVAASGAYYIAAGATKVYANAGTITGSIGVIMEFVNLKDLYRWAKIKRFSIKTGKFKDSGADYREMRPEERALLQGMIDDVLGQFKEAVAEGREMTPEEVTRVADGRIFSGAQAKTNRLVDEIGTLEDAVKEAGKLAGIEGDPKTIYPRKEKRQFLQYMMNPYPEDDEDAMSPIDHLAAGFAKALGLPAGQLQSRAPLLPTPGIYWVWTGEN